MLRETYRFRNYGGCANRRSFTHSDMDLYLWFNLDSAVEHRISAVPQASGQGATCS